MTNLTIQLDGNRLTYKPGENLQGIFSWCLDNPCKALELRLFWYTQGKGTQDLAVVQTQRVEAPPLFGQENFRFPLPIGPYSFAGTLITLTWALELVTVPGKDTQRLDFTLSPTDRSIYLSPIPGSGTKQPQRFSQP